MTKKYINDLSPQASRLLAVVIVAVEFSRTSFAFIADFHIARRGRLKYSEIPAALNELRSAGLLETKQGRQGCLYTLPAGSFPFVWKAE